MKRTTLIFLFLAAFAAFSQTSCGTVTDYDGNTYNTVQIGSQCWMAENLRTTHYNDGKSIPFWTEDSNVNPYLSYPGGKSSNVQTYGYLYNWPAVMHGEPSSKEIPSGVQGICPNGWHVPSDAEWKVFTDYVSSQSQFLSCAGNDKIVKSLASKEGWYSEPTTYYGDNCLIGLNPELNNATGFTARPAGVHHNGSDYLFSEAAYFWSSTESLSTYAWYRFMNFQYLELYKENRYRSFGCSVRCLRD